MPARRHRSGHATVVSKNPDPHRAPRHGPESASGTPPGFRRSSSCLRHWVPETRRSLPVSDIQVDPTQNDVRAVAHSQANRTSSRLGRRSEQDPPEPRQRHPQAHQNPSSATPSTLRRHDERAARILCSAVVRSVLKERPNHGAAMPYPFITATVNITSRGSHCLQ